MTKEKPVLLLDTTMRDGEQTPGVSMTPDQKVMLARKLDEIGVDIIEGGSAIASAGEREALKRMAKEGFRAEIASFARILRKDIDAILETGISTVCLVVSTSDIHIQKKLKKTREEVVSMTLDCIDYAKAHGLIVDLLAEDGSRTDRDFLTSIFTQAVSAGASRVTVCDTVGVLAPERTAELYQHLAKHISVPLGVHCHNDLGLAVANTLTALRNGARIAHVTVNGMGERTGNAPLEEVAVDLQYLYGIKTVATERLYELSLFTEMLTGFHVGINKPIVGKNAFVHESGIHVDGILKESSTYEPITPEMIGRKRMFILGKHSGQKAIRLKLQELGVEVTPEQEQRIFTMVKEIGDKGKHVTDADFHVIVMDVLGQKFSQPIKLKELVAVTGNLITPTASVRLEVHGEDKSASALGNGPVDAAINAIETILGTTNVKLVDYRVEAITGGTDALVNVHVTLQKEGREITSSAASTDIVKASVDAVLRGINVLLASPSR